MTKRKLVEDVVCAVLLTLGVVGLVFFLDYTLAQNSQPAVIVAGIMLCTFGVLSVLFVAVILKEYVLDPVQRKRKNRHRY